MLSRSGFIGPQRQGGWINLALGAVSTLLGRKDKKDADRQASADRARELEIEQGHLDLARKQDERAGVVFDHYTDTYLPRERQLVSEAFDRTISPARAESRAVGDVRSALATARDMSQRSQRRYGIDPSSGTALEMDRATSLDEARIEAGARTSAREGVRDVNFRRQASALGFASPTAATPYASGAQAGTAGALSLAGARSSESASVARGAAQDYGAGLGELADAAADLWRNRRRREA